MKAKEKNTAILNRYLAIWSIPIIILLIGILWFGHWESHPEINIPEKVITILFLANFPILAILSISIKKNIPLLILNGIVQIIVTFVFSAIASMMVNGMWI
ncbi:hypothetical protein C0416_00995 [bacterium]|nr:hypothetical protein [bacterium]